MASAGSASLTTSVQQIFNATNDGGPCQVFTITNLSSSAGKALVNIPGLHDAGEYAPIEPGQTMPFKSGNGIQQVNVKSDSTASIDFEVESR